MSINHNQLCKRCNKTFTCKLDDVENCKCKTIKLSATKQQFLAQTNWDCLCVDCLQHYNELTERCKAYQFPTQQNEFVEQIHFYTENNTVVFTEIYHFLRGYCCKNGCRHCVYGYEKV